MKRHLLLPLYVFLFTEITLGQQDAEIIPKDAYLAEQKLIGKAFAEYFYPNYASMYSLKEPAFVSKIDSVRNIFDALLQKYGAQLDYEFLQEQSQEIKYYFDKILLDYPNNHDTYSSTEKKTTFSKSLSTRLKNNIQDFNKPALLSNEDFRTYVRSYFYFLVSEELSKPVVTYADNKMLNITWNLIPTIISNIDCREFWQSEYLYNHIDNNGIKNIEMILADFRSSCRNDSLLTKVNHIYSEDSTYRQGHLTKVYKSVNDVNLDVHLFLPDSTLFKGKHPVYVYFHGGSWSEGKPDFGFFSCERFSKKGWVGVAVEYRTAYRHNSSPFESVMDARSAIRWLRKHADVYNIDPERIVATGSSAGGHLVLSTSLADSWNEKTDDLQINPSPNVLVVIAGAYDLTIENTKWIVKDLENKELVKKISPNHLVKKNIPALLMIHGTKDMNCPYWTAQEFRNEMENTDSILEFHALEGAEHFIWYDSRYTGLISDWRNDFLSRLGYE